MSKKYKNPPLIETLCEFQFQQTSPWDLAIPGIIYDKVQSSFPKRRQTNSITIDLSPSGETSPKLGSSPLTQFWSEDESSLIQVGEYIFTINHLKPYPSWNTFFPMIKEGFTTYLAVAAPIGFRSITLRYINRIEFVEHPIMLNDYFEFRPYTGPNLPQDHGPFNLTVQLPYENSRDILNVQLASLVGFPTTNSLAINLDLSYILNKPDVVTQDNVFSWLDDAHKHVEEVFEACITDLLRKKFEEVSE